MKILAIVAPALLLAACGGAVPPPRTTAALPTPRPMPGVVDRLMGLDAAGLTRVFGRPDAEMREGTARKLQFQGAFCVLDAYLYPAGKDQHGKDREPTVAHVDARQPDGSPIDRASCVSALERRGGGK